MDFRTQILYVKKQLVMMDFVKSAVSAAEGSGGRGGPLVVLKNGGHRKLSLATENFQKRLP